MARCSFLWSPRLLLLLVLGVVVGGDVAATATARPLLGIAEPPLPGVAAAGPAGVARPGRRPDRSIAGAEVILAGFAAVVMAVIFCYIRVTRKSNARAGMEQKA